MGEEGASTFVYTRTQHQKSLNIFGWVDLIGGSHGITKWISGNTDGFIQVLGKIIYRFKGKTIDLWVDNARWHRHKGAREEALIVEIFGAHY